MAKPVFSAKHFHDEQAAFDHIEALLWPNGPVCPHCGGEGYAMKVIGKASVRKDGTVKPAPIRLGVKKCRACQVQFTVRVGTIFEDSRAPMHVWLQAIALLAASKKGMSSNQLSRTLGVTLKTAWFMSHRIRMAMTAGGSRGPLGGAGKVVEVDETYFGKVEKPRTVRADGRPYNPRGARGPANKRPIIALVERGGQARVFHVAEATKKTVAKLLEENVDRRSRLHTDESNLYPAIGKTFAAHETVAHKAGEYARGDVHNNTAEGFFGVFKKGMSGVYQHCAEKHLHRYVGEFAFRLGDGDVSRHTLDRLASLFSAALGCRLTYKDLIA